jgi:hypothetical protein
MARGKEGSGCGLFETTWAFSWKYRRKLRKTSRKISSNKIEIEQTEAKAISRKPSGETEENQEKHQSVW